MDAIRKRLSELPVVPTDLRRWILVGKARLEAQIKAIKALNKLEDSVAARMAALSDTQDLAAELLYAEARLGEILKNLDKSPARRSSRVGTSSKVLPEGITKKESHLSQKLYRNEEEIEKVVAESRQEGTIPLRHHVLQRIDQKKPKTQKDRPSRETPPIIDAEVVWAPKDIIERLRECEKHVGDLQGVDVDALKAAIGAAIEVLTRKMKPKKPKGNGLVAEFEDEFWPNVPVKMDKKKAREVYVKARATVPKETILAGLPGYRAKEERRAKKDDYQAHSPYRWLRDERWTDEVIANGTGRTQNGTAQRPIHRRDPGLSATADESEGIVIGD